eukprot:m.216628 g.216628  ORF g.216628 m.216628 type:complete len:93 (+) comp39873_c0_seq15:5031-5309(+)
MERRDRPLNGPTTFSLELPEMQQRKSRPNSCRGLPFGPPPAQRSRPSSSLHPGISTRTSLASVNLSALLVSRASNNGLSGGQPGEKATAFPT